MGVEEGEGGGGGGGAQPICDVPLEGREQKKPHRVPAGASWVGCNILVKRDPATTHGRAPSKSTKASFSSITIVQLLSHVQLCDPMDCPTPGLPVLHRLPELAQTHVHRVGDAIQPSRPVIPFPSCLQSFPASGSFLTSQLFSTMETHKRNPGQL